MGEGVGGVQPDGLFERLAAGHVPALPHRVDAPRVPLLRGRRHVRLGAARRPPHSERRHDERDAGGERAQRPPPRLRTRRRQRRIGVSAKHQQ